MRTHAPESSLFGVNASSFGAPLVASDCPSRLDIRLKHLFHRLKLLCRSDFARRGDSLKAESRVEMSRAAEAGKSWEQMSKNVAHLGIDANSGEKAKMIFSAGPAKQKNVRPS